MLQVLELDPNFVPALQRYGVFRWRFDGKLVEAIQYIEHAIALDPNNSRLRQNAEALYLDLDDVTAARDSGRRHAAQCAHGRDCFRCTKAIGGMRDSLHTMRRVGQRTTTTAKLAGKRSASRLCNEDGRTEPGDCVHQTEVLFGRRSSGHIWTHVISARPSIYHS